MSMPFLERIWELEQEKLGYFDRIEELERTREVCRKDLIENLKNPINDGNEVNNRVNQLTETDKEISRLKEELEQLKSDISKLKDFPSDMYNFVDKIIYEDDITLNELTEMLSNWRLKERIQEIYWEEINEKYWEKIEIPETLIGWKTLLIPFEIPDKENDKFIEFLFFWEDIEFDWRDFFWDEYKKLNEKKHEIIDAAVKTVIKNKNKKSSWYKYGQTLRKLRKTSDEQSIEQLNHLLDNLKWKILEDIKRYINRLWYNELFEKLQNYKLNTIKNYYRYLIKSYENYMKKDSNDEVSLYLTDILNWMWREKS